MAQSIFNVCYVGFIDQFQELLGWKRVNKDVSSCYYQATRLIILDDLMQFFSHQFFAQHSISNADEAMSDEDYITSVAIGFEDYVRDLKKCDDKWISTCAVFLDISHDLVEFTNAYRIGDSIAIELGYQKHSFFWEVLGQNKYVETFFGQQETMYQDSPFSRL